MVDELNNLLKTRNDSFTSKEKKFLELLLKKQEFVALISRGILKKMDEQRRIKQKQIEELKQEEEKASSPNYYDQNPSITRPERIEVKKIKEKKRGIQRTLHNIDALVVISDVLGMLANSFWVQPMLGFSTEQNLEEETTEDMIKSINQISENKIEEEIEKYQKTWELIFPMVEKIFKMAAKQYNFIPNIEQFVDELLFSFSHMPYMKSFVMSKPLIEKMSKLSQGQDAMQILKMGTDIRDKTTAMLESAKKGDEK